jgi:hypothetical protein
MRVPVGIPIIPANTPNSGPAVRLYCEGAGQLARLKTALGDDLSPSGGEAFARPCHHLVHVRALQYPETADVLLGLQIRPVGHEDSAVLLRSQRLRGPQAAREFPGARQQSSLCSRCVRFSSRRTPKRTERYERQRKICKSCVDFGAAHSTSKCSGTTAGHSQYSGSGAVQALI